MITPLIRTTFLFASRVCVATCHNLNSASFKLTNFSALRKYSLSTMAEQIKIATHNGCFHCDEALACFMLKLLPRYKDAEIVRSRDPEVLDTCDIVIDVGGIYDPSKHRYDHHMRDFKETFASVLKKSGDDYNVKLSSAGLIYCHFGREIIRHLLPSSVLDSDINTIFTRVYKKFIREIDCIDNGIPMYNEEPLYHITTDISSRVARLNPAWNSKDQNSDEKFPEAMKLVGEEFMYFVNETANIWLPASAVVRESLDKRLEVHPSGEIMELSQPVPWIEQLLVLEEELNISPPLKYAIFKSENDYRVRAVPVKYGSFRSRKPLPESWRGLRNEELKETSGIDDTIFVHSTGFIGGATTKEGALAMARKALASK